MNKEKVIELKKHMEDLEINQQAYKILKDEFDNKNAELITYISWLNSKINNCKEILKENAEVGYLQDGEKKRLGGIGIRVGKQLNYDKLVALKWAKDKDLFLQLDTKAFENVAKTGELDFVEITDKITVTFPKKIIINEVV